MDEESTKCRLCSYQQADRRLMVNIFDKTTEYSKKIESYLSIKILHSSQPSHHFICFHCSQTLDNFHNFATRIQAIQKIIFPQSEEVESIQHATFIEVEEIEVPHLELPEVIIQKSQPSTSDLTVIDISKSILNILESPSASKPQHRRSQRTNKNEKLFEELRKNVQIPKCDSQLGDTMSELQSHRSFDLDDQFCDSDEEIEDFTTLRDAEDEDFPSAEALQRIPTKVIDESGKLLYKGKKLTKFLSIFYNTRCKICDIKFRSISLLFQHQSESHTETHPFVTCCSMKLEKMPKIIWHFAEHIEPEAFKCDLCDYAVSRPKFLETHKQTHKPECEKPLECDKCEKRFIWKGALKNHLINHQSERPEFICNICNRKYQTAGSLSSHKKSAHIDTEKTRKLCEICSKSFSTFTSYKEHLTLHREDRDKMQLKCEECGKWLKNKRCLKSHLLLHTSSELKCNLCCYTTKKEKLMKNHMMTKHCEDKKFVCDQPECDKSFKVKRALTIHLQQHGGKSTARKCEFCGREFASSTNYYTHRKNIHAKELQEVNEKKIEDEKLKRIRAGLEEFNVGGQNRVEVDQTPFEERDEPIIFTLTPFEG